MSSFHANPHFRQPASLWQVNRTQPDSAFKCIDSGQGKKTQKIPNGLGFGCEPAMILPGAPETYVWPCFLAASAVEVLLEQSWRWDKSL